MRYSYDESKRARVLQDRGLDLADAAQVFEGFYLSRADPKHSRDEQRTITAGMMRDEVVVLVVWTPRPGERRIITMKANDKERRHYHEQRRRHG